MSGREHRAIAFVFLGAFVSRSLFATAPRPSLDVQIDGLGGTLSGLVANRSLKGSDLRQNVMSVLSIEQARTDKGLTDRRIRELHALAPDEIRHALQPFGYYRPTIDGSLDVTGGDHWVARYMIDPGPVLEVGGLDLEVTGEGSTDWGFRTVVRDFPLKKGDALFQPAYDAGKAAFEEMASSIGYLDGKFDVAELRIDLAAYTSRIVLHYDTGRQYLFGPVVFRQNVLDPDVLRGYVTWERGEPLNLKKLLGLQNALSDAPYFSRVEVVSDPDRAKGLEVPIEVALTPAKPRKYQFGLGYGTDTGPRASIHAEYRRLNRRGHRAEADLKFSGIEKSLAAKYLIPGSYPRTDMLTFTVGYAHLTPSTSDTTTELAGVDYSYAVHDWRQGLGLLFEREDYSVGVDKGVSNLLTPVFTRELVVADDRIDTRRGYRIQLRASAAKQGLVSSATFVQAYATGKKIVPLSPSNRLIGRAEIGYTATSQFRRLPPRVRFFAGGDVSVRGYKFNGLGERDEKGHVIGGKAIETVSLEFEHRFLPKWGAAIFADAGNAADRFTGSLKKGVGAGVRWVSPIGPVRLDGAYALDSPRGFRIHVNIGPDL
ncbi:MAG: autotransporter assembly complex protein TamA [Acidobacteriota bacterium]|nr:autotransporter assembly complex protein TamA [Acidobacteriota bacterium]